MAERRCHWCVPGAESAPDGELAVAGHVEQGSGPGFTYWVCPACRDEHRIVPLAEHPQWSTGLPIHRPPVASS